MLYLHNPVVAERASSKIYNMPEIINTPVVLACPLLDAKQIENIGIIEVTEEMKKAVDDIFKYPLKEFARDTLNRQLKAGVSDDGLANLVVSLRDDDKLCITDNEEQANRLPQIICSMGIKNGE